MRVEGLSLKSSNSFVSRVGLVLKYINIEHKRLIALRDNNRRTRYKISFSGKDSLKILLFSSGIDTQPGFVCFEHVPNISGT